jgi:assimilatory nitrate reductase catalytic subunit
VLLPAAAWGEKDGSTTNSERCISRQRAFLPLPGEAKPDWWMVTEVARHLGFSDAFRYRSAADVFREHAALSAFENDGVRFFDLGALAEISNDDYDALAPVQWPVRAGQTGGTERLFASGGFSTPDRKARFIAPDAPALREATSAEFPLRFNTGRLRDQWHTMTRTGQSPKLGAHRPEPFLEIHPLDAKAHGLTPNGFAMVRSQHGSCVLKIVTSAGQQRGSIFVPIHWSDANASSARVGDLVAPQTDPYSGQPEAKATPVAIAPIAFAYCGFALARTRMALPDGTWWAQVALPGTSGWRLASNDAPLAWHERAPMLFPEAVLTEYIDRARGFYRVAAFVDGRLEGALFVGPADAPPQWSDLRDMIGGPGIAASGPVVCACFGVGVAAIHEAMASGKATSVEEIGLALRAGSKCGSCLPELRSIAAQKLHAREFQSHGAHDHTHTH